MCVYIEKESMYMHLAVRITKAGSQCHSVNTRENMSVLVTFSNHCQKVFLIFTLDGNLL